MSQFNNHFILLADENDKSGDELIRLLAPQTMPTSDHVGTIDPSRGYNGTSQIGTWDQDDSSKGGLKVLFISAPIVNVSQYV